MDCKYVEKQITLVRFINIFHLKLMEEYRTNVNMLKHSISSPLLCTENTLLSRLDMLARTKKLGGENAVTTVINWNK